MAPQPVFLKNKLDINELQNEGTVIEVEPEEELFLSSDEDFDDELSNNFKEEFNKLRISENEEIDLSTLTIDELKNKMTPVTEDGLVQKLTMVEGNGVIVPAKSIVLINYDAYVENETKPFDSSYLRGQPHKCVLGAGQLVLGLDKGIATMRKKEHAKFWIEYSYAYGPIGCAPRIPANANIVYNVEIVDFFDCKEAIEFEEMLPDDQKQAPFIKVYEACKVEYSLGNGLFARKKYSPAGGHYARAIRLLEQVSAADEGEDVKRDKLLLKLYSNLSLINFKMNKGRRAICSAKKAERLADYLQDKQPKVYYRLGQAYSLVSEFDLAKCYLLKAKDLEPYNKDITDALADLDNKAKKHASYEKSFCSKMFNSTNNANVAPSQESNDFKEVIENTIKKFIDSDELEFEFPSTFTESQIATVKAITHSHNLYFFEKIYNEQKILKIKKNRE